ncbi:porin [Leucothrix arctica]|nr:porin [Leucothrix arctica]
MKLSIIAIAIAAASMTGAAQAELKVSGDVTVSYQEDGTGGSSSFDGAGTEVIFDASQKVGNLTVFGSATANIGGTGSTVTADDVFLGLKGAFGTVKIGDTDNGCDTVDTGWVADDVFISHDSGGCAGSDTSNVTYSNTRGAMTYAASVSPEDSADNFAVGIKGKMGPVTASFGYENGDLDGDATTSDVDNVVLGLSGNYGPVAVGVRMNQMDGGDTDFGYTAQYAAGANKFYAGFGDVTDQDSKYLGYNRSIGKNTIAVIEWTDKDKLVDNQVAVGLKHSF